MSNRSGLVALLAFLFFRYYDWTHHTYLTENQVKQAFFHAAGPYFKRADYMIIITNDSDANRNGYKTSDFCLVIEVISPYGIFDKRAVRKAKELKDWLRNNGFYKDKKLSNGTADNSRHLCMIERKKVNR